jgi:glycosyltransferase involved in cell wall biosynthesis
VTRRSTGAIRPPEPVTGNGDSAPGVAILHAGDLLEDWLGPLGISIETFVDEMLGSWVFGYMKALQLSGIAPVLICVSCQVDRPAHYTHRPTGANICIVPAPRLYRWLRRRALPRLSGSFNPDGRHPPVQPATKLGRFVVALVRSWVGHVSTPPLQIARQLRRYRCVAVLCQDYEYSRFDVCAILGRVTGMPVFATFQGGIASRWPLRPLRRLGLRACAGLVISAGEEAERVRRRYDVPARKIARIFDPVDLTTWYPRNRMDARAAAGIPMYAKVVVWHGAIEIHVKGLDTLLDAWKRITAAGSGDDLRLLLVGTGTDADEFRERIGDMLGVTWVHEWVLDRNRVATLLSAADVYVFPSRLEGFALSPIEAMACGLPLVAADSRGMPDLLEGGDSSGGVLVPRGDVDALARALLRLLGDDDLRRALGTRARARVESHFAPAHIGKQLRKVLLQEGAP